ncbi:UDP-4-amino-4,6-dideoxy-N-acetyl-beta-L-altrosamine transaminase [Agaribacter marinus]|uniref:UDP-4-amino-4, 6-dideoxy-N-acetyl-beta-L-altrosami ne transaminase n=1 Tax=Agaribacter marinus TaxID=1431249 RepID=A0AA37SX60_9ALTE|nr:UDP-4-amino-4,6-dideoxy-N-acetyl-beta-L-altrosamine transaminase [Agaribacter marinus]GLR70777.1 UDP-4-amino-4,6-dideoxy-N-acetyl-beta-L-altrosami ne transaminase [Agaribacter marinus]
MIPYGKHNINDDDIASVVDVLANKFLTQGDRVPAFEQALCDYTSATYCVAVNSGTSGLHVACLALGIGKGDIVWTSPNSFAASANCALYCGADVDFVDIDPITRNICPEILAAKLQGANAQNRLPKAIVVVHFSGLSCDMQRISKLCQAHNVAIIEDAAHGLGGTYNGKPIGCCEYSDLAVLSFHPVKSITTAEGGAVLTNDDALAKQCELYAKHGITRRAEWQTRHDQGAWYYQQLALGYNYRLSDLQAALGISQLKRVDSFIAERRALAEQYDALLRELPNSYDIRLPTRTGADTSAWHLYMIEVPAEARQAIFDELRAHDVGVNVHYIPIHWHPYYQSLGFSKAMFANAEHFYEGAITLPLYVGLSDDAQKTVVNTLTMALRKYLPAKQGK